MITKTKASIIKIKTLTPTVKEFTFKPEECFEFKAGQFINLSFQAEGETLRKPYSICSNPKTSETISLCIKRVEGGAFTTRLFEKQEGDEVEIMGPLGLFTLADSKEELVFIAAGTGIAPLRSMIYEALGEKEILLLLGVRNENEILYKEEFEELEKKHSNFKFVPIVSRPTEKWSGKTGHVQDNLDLIDSIYSTIYLCGLSIMIEEASSKLLELGVPKEDIKFEKYH